MDCLLNGIELGSKYNETVRMFSLNLRYLSPRGYEYIRNKFDRNLPHTATIRKWFSLSNAGANGGFIDCVLQMLKKLADENHLQNKTIYVSIAFDEMAIRKHVEWLHHKKKFSGFINFGTKQSTDDIPPIATNALVAMLNGINTKITIPIAYYFITNLIAEEKAIMIASIVQTLTEIGIVVKSITSDGLKTNFAAYQILGASFDAENMLPYFENSANGNKIYVFHDPPHLIKLVRNCLGDMKNLSDRFDRQWKFIEQLYRSTQNDLCSHRLTKRHIDWKATPMKVTLATQTLSSSVAHSIGKLADSGIHIFADSEGTVEFIKNFDQLFDVFNSDRDVENNLYKTPIGFQSNNRDPVFSFIDNMIEYIDGLTLMGKPIIQSQRSTGFVGFKSNIIAFKMFIEELVDTNRITPFRTVSIQQDYLESFFGRMRSGNGSNTNPSQEQFSANFRKTLVNRELTCSALSNCIDKLDILTVSSGLSNQRSFGPDFSLIMNANNESEFNQDDENEEVELGLFNPSRNDDERDENAFGDPENDSLTVILGLVNTAGSIEASINRSKKFECDQCSPIFEQNEKNRFVSENETKCVAMQKHHGYL